MTYIYLLVYLGAIGPVGSYHTLAACQDDIARQVARNPEFLVKNLFQCVKVQVAK